MGGGGVVLRADHVLWPFWSRTILCAILKDLPPTQRCLGNVYRKCNWKRFSSAVLFKMSSHSVGGWEGLAAKFVRVETHFRGVETNFGVLRPNLHMLRPILKVLRPVCGLCTIGGD